MSRPGMVRFFPPSNSPLKTHPKAEHFSAIPKFLPAIRISEAGAFFFGKRIHLFQGRLLNC